MKERLWRDSCLLTVSLGLCLVVKCRCSMNFMPNYSIKWKFDVTLLNAKMHEWCETRLLTLLSSGVKTLS